MRDFSDTTTIYTKSLKTVRLKIHQDYIASSDEALPEAGSPDDVHEILKAIFHQLDDDQEHLILLILNVSHEVTGYKVISSGTQTANPTDSKIIFRNALMLGASRIILAHNQPSGNLTASSADILFTEKMVEASKLLDIPILDHIILTHTGYLSFREQKLCEFEPLVGT